MANLFRAFALVLNVVLAASQTGFGAGVTGGGDGDGDGERRVGGGTADGSSKGGKVNTLGLAMTTGLT